MSIDEAKKLLAAAKELLATEHPAEFHLDAILTREECGKWLKCSQNFLRQHEDEITPFRAGDLVRYHPRTVVAQLARRAGIKPVSA